MDAHVRAAPVALRNTDVGVHATSHSKVGRPLVTFNGVLQQQRSSAEAVKPLGQAQGRDQMREFELQPPEPLGNREIGRAHV